MRWIEARIVSTESHRELYAAKVLSTGRNNFLLSNDYTESSIAYTLYQDDFQVCHASCPSSFVLVIRALVGWYIMHYNILGFHIKKHKSNKHIQMSSFNRIARAICHPAQKWVHRSPPCGFDKKDNPRIDFYRNLTKYSICGLKGHHNSHFTEYSDHL